MQGIYSNASSLNARPSNSSTMNQNMNVSRPRKRKDSTFLQSPWHKVYLQPSKLCHSIRSLPPNVFYNITRISHSRWRVIVFFYHIWCLIHLLCIYSVSEQEWALAANTLCEKVPISLILINSSFTKNLYFQIKSFFVGWYHLMLRSIQMRWSLLQRRGLYYPQILCNNFSNQHQRLFSRTSSQLSTTRLCFTLSPESPSLMHVLSRATRILIRAQSEF